MSYVHVQFGDLTEIGGLYARGAGDGLTMAQFVRANVRTEFAFGTSANPSAALIKAMGEAGMKPVSAMRNWYSGHVHDSKDKKLVLFFGRVPQPEYKMLPRKPETWEGGPGATNAAYLQGSGCGFKIQGEPPFQRKSVYRFFSLLRVPHTNMKEWRPWLMKHHFKPVGTGQFAAFWCNGWNLKHWTWDLETKYFEKKGVCVDQSYSIDGPAQRNEND